MGWDDGMGWWDVRVNETKNNELNQSKKIEIEHPKNPTVRRTGNRQQLQNKPSSKSKSNRIESNESNQSNRMNENQ